MSAVPPFVQRTDECGSPVRPQRRPPASNSCRQNVPPSSADGRRNGCNDAGVEQFQWNVLPDCQPKPSPTVQETGRAPAPAVGVPSLSSGERFRKRRRLPGAPSVSSHPVRRQHPCFPYCAPARRPGGGRTPPR